MFFIESRSIDETISLRFGQRASLRSGLFLSAAKRPTGCGNSKYKTYCIAFLGSWGQAGTDGIQIHINHAGGNRSLVEQGLTFESGFPESALDFIFIIGGSGDEFVEAAHKPAEATLSLEIFLRPRKQWHIMGVHCS